MSVAPTDPTLFTPHAAEGNWLQEWWADKRTQWIFLRVSISERLVYRGDFFLGTFMRFLPIVTQIFLWEAVFASVAATSGQSPDAAKIVGYTSRDVIAYYLLTMITRAFSSMPGLASGVAKDVRDGTIKKYLLQPVDMISLLFLSRLAHKLVYYVVAAIPFAIVFYICRSYFPGWPDAGTFAAFLLSLALAFLLGFYLELTIGLMSFWILEISSLLFVFMLFSFFFSGHMFPIDMLPGAWRWLVEATPFIYLAYFSSAVFLGKITGAALAWGLAIQAGWVLFFMLTSRLAFHYGAKRYSAFGG